MATATTLEARDAAVMDLMTVVTGGATGADALAESLAEEWGMKVKLCLPPHHHRVSEKHPAVPYTTLRHQDAFVDRANVRLKRQPSRNPFVRDLLSRNWSIVKQAKVIFAYGEFEDDSERWNGDDGSDVRGPQQRLSGQVEGPIRV